MDRRILIGDNDEEVRNGLHILLSGVGYTPFVAADGVSLIEQARRCRPHLIMFDYCLPAGNAVALVQALRRFQDFTRTPIFIFARREFRTQASHIFDAGASAFLPKPFNRQVLFSLIARFMPSEAPANSSAPLQSIESDAGRVLRLAQV
jgi:DNA-binding response OmpR family regulator